MNHHLCYASVSEWGTAYQVDNAHHLDMVIGAYYADDAPTRTQVEADAVRVYVALSRYITSLNDSNAPRAALLAVPSSVVLLTADPLSMEFLTQWNN